MISTSCRAAVFLGVLVIISTNGFVVVPLQKRSSPAGKLFVRTNKETDTSSSISSSSSVESLLDKAAKDLAAVLSNQVTHKGGNAGYLDPVVRPANLDDEEECQEIYHDFATGDELCWGEAPTHARNVVERTATTAMEERHVTPDVVDDYHKGGNARYEPKVQPRRLTMDQLKDCDGEHHYIDFETGDELCWPEE